MKQNKYLFKNLMEWAKAFLYALAILLIIQTVFLNKFHYTNSSMSPLIENGDYIIINKWSIGSRLPNSIMGTSIPLPTLRLPFGDNIDRFDVIAFNNPLDSTHPINQKSLYVKRIAALPGESFSLKKGNILINNKAIEEHFITKKPYSIQFHPDANPRQVLASIGEYELYGPHENNVCRTNLDPNQLKRLEQSPWVKSIQLVDWKDGIHPNTAFHCPHCEWDLDNFGPIKIPSKGDTIPLNTNNLHLYQKTIELYENKKIHRNGDSIILDKQLINTYVFSQDYYFFLGDNRHNSIDSRFFGLVPKDHLIGEVNFVLFNFDKSNPYKLIQWDRTFKSISAEE